MTPPKIGLVEVFAAPQGEGYNAGRSAVFVRLAGCPLACEFAPGVVCDTPYMRANMKVTLDELFEDIIPPLVKDHEGYRNRNRRRREEGPMLILTGGEPTACPQFDAIVYRAYNCKTPAFYVAVETNGARWRSGLCSVDWISISPKCGVPQTSHASQHNTHPRQSPILDSQLIRIAAARTKMRDNLGAEYRYVIASRQDPAPPYLMATRHYLSPAVRSNGSGEEWRAGFPGFAHGAVLRCLEICKADPRWRISIQTHKVLGVR